MAPPTQELPPFSSSTPCAKCSYTDAFTEYKPEGEPRSGSASWGTGMPARLERRCGRCDFVWDEALNPPGKASSCKPKEYPYEDGDVTVLGPEVFASADGQVISWKGDNYVRQAQPDPTSSIAGHVEVRDPCPYCGDHQLIPRHRFAEHVARLHPDARDTPTDD